MNAPATSQTDRPRHLLLMGAAILFAVLSGLYSAVWMYYIGKEPTARLGTQSDFVWASSAFIVRTVSPGSPAERAGLRPGDRIVTVNNRPLHNPAPFYDAIHRGRPGDTVTLRVVHPDNQQRVVQSVLAERPKPPPEPLAEVIGGYLLRGYPLLFYLVGIVVLFQRLHDPNAWLLALFFAAFVAGAPLFEERLHPAVRGPALAYKAIFLGLWLSFFYFFFAVFPAPSPIDRRVPWVKWVILIGTIVAVVPLAVAALVTGTFEAARAYVGQRFSAAGVIFGVWTGLVTILGLASLVLNAKYAPSVEARRKTRVIIWGTVAAVVPLITCGLIAGYLGKDPYEFPFWIWQPVVLCSYLLPLSFAYAVAKHRVLEIPVLLRRSARYVLVQRGFMMLIVLISLAVTFVFAVSFPRLVQISSTTVLPAGLLAGAGFGVVLAWVGVEAGRRVTRRLDRAFFRSSYDARQILEELAEETRAAGSREALATLLVRRLRDALHPRLLAVYLEGPEGALDLYEGDAPREAHRLAPTNPALREVTRTGRPWDVPPMDSTDSVDLSALQSLQPECLVPIAGRAGQLLGLLVLGPRLSEEPYSGEDKRLLASVSSQAGSALENVSLAQRMAERLEAERRTAHEMEIAKDVQRKLFPQKAPPLKTLDYAGRCIQARAVGGDYYDFLDLGIGHVAFVLADISGKGISAALLMASLQANLRSQYAIALDDLPRLLESVNRLLYDSTAPNHYATLFFGMYDDQKRRLRYVNCGHNPPMVLKAHGSVQRLAPTAIVIGLFEDWRCSVEETTLSPGDTLVVFSDGVTEAFNDREEEFGEDRLIQAVRKSKGKPADALLDEVCKAVRRFSSIEQSDDLTLIIARARD